MTKVLIPNPLLVFQHKRTSIFSTFIFVVAAAFLMKPAHSTENVYTIGYVPQQSAAVLAKLWGPIIKKVSENSGVKLAFRTAPNIPQFEDRLRKGEYDFGYMNPVHYTVFSEAPGYRAFAKQKGKIIKGIIVTRKDAEIKDLSELKDHTLAFPAPAAFAASVLPRSFFSSNNIEITPKYVGSHDSVYHGVAKGHFIAGGGIQRTLGTVDPKIGTQLKVLWTTQGYTPHAFAAHPRVPREVVTAVESAFVKLFEDQKGQELLTKVGFKKGIESARDDNWNDVRALGITKL